MTPEAARRIALFVLAHLPDSLRLRQTLLEDLLVIVPEDDELHSVIVMRLRALEQIQKAELVFSFMVQV